MHWLYHPTQPPHLFEDDENPAGWFDHPDKCKEPKKVVKKTTVKKATPKKDKT